MKNTVEGKRRSKQLSIADEEYLNKIFIRKSEKKKNKSAKT